MRLKHNSYRTEQMYLGRVGSFSGLRTGMAAANLGENDMRDLLNRLALVGNVSSSTQNQAFSALVFLYQRSAFNRHTASQDGLSFRRSRSYPSRKAGSSWVGSRPCFRIA